MTDRHCGSCTLCCKLLPVRELAKDANTKCRHQSSKGCAIYRRPGFPASCHLWSCRWLVADDTADMLRPDRAGYVLDMMPDIMRLENNDTGEAQEIEVVQVWVEGSNAALVFDKRLRRYAERQAERGAALLLRLADGSAIAMFAPALSSDSQWRVIDSGDARMKNVQPQSGSRLLDALKQTKPGTESV